MIKLFIIKLHNGQNRNGIDTYIDSIVNCFRYSTQIELHLITISNADSNITIENLNSNKISIPYVTSRRKQSVFSGVAQLLKINIVDKQGNIFLLNNSPCSILIRQLKQNFPLTKVMFIIHNQEWCSVFWGQETLFRKFITQCDHADNEVDQSILDDFFEEQQIYKLSDSVVCLSNSTLNLLKDIYGVPENKIKLIPNSYSNYGVSIKFRTREEVRKDLGISPKTKLGIFVGRMTQLKGIKILLNALVELKDNMRELDIKVVLIGSLVYNPELKSNYTSLSDCLIFTDRLNFEEVINWYIAADIGIIPSYTEQCSFVALEMMYYNLLIVSSNCNGLRDMFSNNNAFIAEIGDSNSYIESLKQALYKAFTCSEHLRQPKISINKSLILSKYSVVSMRELYLSQFKTVTSM